MLLTRLGNYFGGIVYIKIQGIIPEKFVNLCLANNILLWNVTKREQDLYAYIRLGDFFAIRPLVKVSQTRVEVRGYNGFPFFLKKMKHRKMLVIGALLFCFLLDYCSSFVWFVDVQGLQTLSKNEVLRVAYEQGLRVGSKKDTIEQKNVENTLLVTIPQVAWVSVHFMGTRAVIEVVEKTFPKEESKEPAHVVADKDGVITEMIVVAGQGVVKQDDTVKKGDILIRGESPLGFAAGIKASGIVKAKVWYESYGEDWLVRSVPQRTGNKVSSFCLTIGNEQFVLKRVDELPFATYDTEVLTKKIPWWRNNTLPVESTMQVFYETLPVLIEKSRDACLEEAKRQALAALTEQIPKNAQILTRNIEVMTLDEPNVVRVKIRVEAIENIGKILTIVQGG